MSVIYEWDVEERAAAETDAYAEGDVIEHWHHDSYADCLKFIAQHPASEGTKYQIVLVRDDMECRSWAEIDDGKLPEMFEDGEGKQYRIVPKRFHDEVTKATGSAA